MKEMLIICLDGYLNKKHDKVVKQWSLVESLAGADRYLVIVYLARSYNSLEIVKHTFSYCLTLPLVKLNKTWQCTSFSDIDAYLSTLVVFFKRDSVTLRYLIWQSHYRYICFKMKSPCLFFYFIFYVYIFESLLDIWLKENLTM
jgi:hypothetical protein